MKYHAYKSKTPFDGKSFYSGEVYHTYCGKDFPSNSKHFCYDKRRFAQHYAREMACKTCQKAISDVPNLLKGLSVNFVYPKK